MTIAMMVTILGSVAVLREVKAASDSMSSQVLKSIMKTVNLKVWFTDYRSQSIENFEEDQSYIYSTQPLRI